MGAKGGRPRSCRHSAYDWSKDWGRDRIPSTLNSATVAVDSTSNRWIAPVIGLEHLAERVMRKRRALTGKHFE